MKRFALVLGAAALQTPAVALAENDGWDGGYGIKAERRSGFAAAVGLGVGFGMADGYPNALSKQNNPLYESNIDAGVGSNWSLWAGGAFILHIEAFPAWSLGGRFRDLSAFAEFGAGGMTIEGGPEKADAGLLSVLGFGVNYELFRWGHIELGPTLSSNYMYSESMSAFGVFAGVRSTFYGGP
jgi:hypothetical protein